MLPCALASRQHSKFISRQSVRRLLQTNGASFSRLTSSTIRICFCAFRTVPKHMLMQNWQKLYFTVANWLTLWGPLHLSLMGLLKCQFWDGGGRCTLPSWDTKLWCIQNQAEISRLKIKFGDLPESEAAWNKNPHRAENFHSVPASLVNLVPTERGPSKRGLGGSYNFGNTKWRWATERWFQDTCFHGKHVGLLALFEENNGVGRSFTWPVQIRWYWRWPLNWREQTCRAVSHWKYLTGLGLPLIFQLVGRVNWKHGLWMLVLTYPHHIQKSVKSSPILILLIQPWDRLNVTTLKDTKICWKPFSASISTSCSDFLHRHKTEPRPERHRL